MSAETKMIRILAADDHALLRRGIASLIDIEPDMELWRRPRRGARRSSGSGGTSRTQSRMRKCNIARQFG